MRPVVIADHRIPVAASLSLSEYGHLITVGSSHIVYDAISGHPDIFFCKTADELIVAPNTPIALVDSLKSEQIKLKIGRLPLGNSYPQTAHYNAVVTPNFLIHNKKYTDKTILDACQQLEIIDVKQAYCRCNTLSLRDNKFIVSDKGIEKALLEKGCGVLFIDPKEILLPGFDHGFIGGCAGVYQNTVFFIGSLENHTQGNAIKSFLSGYEIVELYAGKLFDGGGLVFID